MPRAVLDSLCRGNINRNDPRNKTPGHKSFMTAASSFAISLRYISNIAYIAVGGGYFRRGDRKGSKNRRHKHIGPRMNYSRSSPDLRATSIWILSGNTACLEVSRFPIGHEMDKRRALYPPFLCDPIYSRVSIPVYPFLCANWPAFGASSNKYLHDKYLTILSRKVYLGLRVGHSRNKYCSQWNPLIRGRKRILLRPTGKCILSTKFLKVRKVFRRLFYNII